MERKKCSKCWKRQPVEEFNWKYKKKGIRQSRCRICTASITKAHYYDNKDDYKKRAKAFRDNLRRENSLKLVEYLKQHPCVDCGEQDPVVLQFDHVIGKKKKAVSVLLCGAYHWKKIKQEIAKCKVRCANCHCRKTAKQLGWKYKGA